MNFRTVFNDMSGWGQLLFLCFITFISFLFGLTIMSVLIRILPPLTAVGSLRLVQFVNATFLFIVPSLCFLKLVDSNKGGYRGVDALPSKFFIFLAILLIIFIQPFVFYANYLNQQIILPASMQSVQEWMTNAENVVEELLGKLLADKSVFGITLNFLIIALLAGLGEELFFRGCLQQIAFKIIKNNHIAIWVTAIIFSAIHFQFYGFFPRMLLGALLGYLFVWSGSLLTPIIIHSLHNAINVSLLQLYYGTPQYKQMENMGVEKHIWLVFMSVSLSCVILHFLLKNKRIR